MASQVFTQVISMAAGAIKETINIGSAFESQMSIGKAISGATANEMVKLSDKAKYMGANTQFTAAESGKAFE